jgi:hypothetical protein
VAGHHDGRFAVAVVDDGPLLKLEPEPRHQPDTYRDRLCPTAPPRAASASGLELLSRPEISLPLRC